MKDIIEETELWKAFKQGQRTAFSLLYRQNAKALFRYGLKITSDSQIVEDAIQDLFVDLWNTRENLTDPDSIKYYLLGILRRKIIRKISHSNAAEGLENHQEHNLLVVEPIENEIVNFEKLASQTRNIQTALSNLSPRQQEAINLRYYFGLTHAQISKVMGISVQSVHNILQKAVKALQQLLISH